MRVALFTGNYNHIPDGVSLTLNRLVAHLNDRNVPVKIFGPSVTHPPMDHEGDFSEVPSIPAPGRPEYRISTGFPLYAQRELKDFAPDLIHIATPDYLGLRALLYARNNNIPVVASYHTHFASYLRYYGIGFLEPWIWAYLRWFYRQCRCVYVPSSGMGKLLRRQEVTDTIKIWSRGVDTNLFSPEKRSQPWRASYGFTSGDTVVLFVSRLVREKNLATLAQAMDQAMNVNANIKTLIVGDGPAREELEQELPEAVFTGHLKGEELAAAYASSDLFFFPSDTETFGNVTLEAMASGLPALVANATGSASLIENGKHGYIVNADDAITFTERIRSLAEDPQRLASMGSASRKKAEQFTWSNVMDELLEHYRHITAAY